MGGWDLVVGWGRVGTRYLWAQALRSALLGFEKVLADGLSCRAYALILSSFYDVVDNSSGNGRNGLPDLYAGLHAALDEVEETHTRWAFHHDHGAASAC